MCHLVGQTAQCLPRELLSSLHSVDRHHEVKEAGRRDREPAKESHGGGGHEAWAVVLRAHHQVVVDENGDACRSARCSEGQCSRDLQMNMRRYFACSCMWNIFSVGIPQGTTDGCLL